MKAYEILFIVDPTINDETRAGAMKRIDTAITENGGVIDNVDNWGKRKLAYEIDKLTEGDYTLINFQADPDQIAELEKAGVIGSNNGVKADLVAPTTSAAK